MKTLRILLIISFMIFSVNTFAQKQKGNWQTGFNFSNHTALPESWFISQIDIYSGKYLEDRTVVGIGSGINLIINPGFGTRQPGDPPITLLESTFIPIYVYVKRYYNISRRGSFFLASNLGGSFLLGDLDISKFNRRAYFLFEPNVGYSKRLGKTLLRNFEIGLGLKYNYKWMYGIKFGFNF